MWQFLESLENSGFSIWIRETPSVLAYPTILAFHSFGMAFLCGFSTMIAVRMFGYAPDIPLASMEKLYKLTNIGFLLAAVSGVVLIIQAATVFTVMPIFYVKLAGVAGAMFFLVTMRKHIAGARKDAPVPSEAKFKAAMMLAFWAIAIVAGRLTAYAFNPIGIQSIIAIAILWGAILVVLKVGGKMMPEKSARPANVRTSSGY